MLMPMARPRLSEEAVQQIRRLIEAGKLRPGDKLPTERQLTDMLRVGRGSVREALRTLEALGLIEVRPGRGTFVRPPTPEERQAIVFEALESDFEDLMEVRSTLEIRAATLAAQRATEQDVADMQSAIDEMRASLAAADVDRLVLGDMAFHQAVTRATKNRLFARLETVIAHHLMESRRLSLSTEGAAERSIERHQLILNAIMAKDGDWASSLMLDGIKALAARVRDSKQKEERVTR